MNDNTTADITTTFAIFLSDRSRGIHSAISVLRTIAYYLLVSDRTLLTLFSELLGSLLGRQDARTRTTIEQLVDRLVSASSTKTIRLIIDGIDEIDGEERIPLLKFLLQLSTTHAKSFNLLISGREDWDIKGKLASYPKIVVNENNGGDIGLYIQACQNELVDQFYPHLRRDEITLMLEPLPLRSDGTLYSLNTSSGILLISCLHTRHVLICPSRDHQPQAANKPSTIEGGCRRLAQGAR